jgi:hypothetical protein
MLARSDGAMERPADAGPDPLVAAAADYLRIGAAELERRIAEGESVGDIALLCGRSVQGVVDAIAAASQRAASA